MTQKPPNGSASDNSPRRRSVLVAGIPVDDVDLDEAVNRIWALVAHGRATGRHHQVATVNVDFVVGALGDGRIARILSRTSLSIPDGMPIIWGSRLLGSHLRTRVAGADLVPALVERAAQGSDVTIALIGSAPGVADAAAALLRRRHPGASIVSHAGPSFSDVDAIDPEELNQLRELDADVACIAMGNPKQELFIARHGPHLAFPVMIGVGGTLDFIVGEKRRAPRWMQRSGLEWLHRALSEPRRLAKRYARDAVVFLPALARQAWSGRATSAPTAEIIVSDDGTTLSATDGRRVDNTVANRLATAVRRPPTALPIVLHVDDEAKNSLPPQVAKYVTHVM